MSPRVSIRSGAAAAGFALLGFSACLFDRGRDGADGHGPSGQGRPKPGMTWVKAAGKAYLQGSSAGQAQPLEGPAVPARFTYDFQMDTVEITQDRFRELLGRNPVSPESPYGSGGDLPVYNVTWFDAVLFCNARSKAEGLDTVYEYLAADANPDGSVYSLRGLVSRLDRKGFRLPTESEWEYAARAGGNGEFPWGGWQDSAAAREHAWYSGNSGNAVHPAARLRPNAFGLYDMAGNVMEWTNDWKAAYPRSGLVDFAGARDPGPESDSPVKGGAFKFGLRELRPAARSAIYAAIRSSRAEYVGFRCALGAVDAPRFSSPSGALAVTDAILLETTRLQNLVEGRPAKLVFVNASPERRHLAYVDYRVHPPRVREFEDVPNVFYPVISPDGAWVAFGTAVEGSVEGSVIHIRSLDHPGGTSLAVGPGFIPRWWVAEQDTFLVYTTSAVDNTQPQWTSSRTLLQKVSGGRPVGAPAALAAPGGFHDGRSLDGRWLATGFRFLKIHDARTGAVRTLFTAPENGKAGTDTSQVCNVSMAPDSSGRTLFLDFGYGSASALTGSFYDIHQTAFMAEPGGKVLRWYQAPPEVRGWEDLEWSNRAGYAVSSSTDQAGRRQGLYLLDLEDSTSTRLATGTWLATPGLWLGEAPDSIPAAGLDLDSLGHYNTPATDAFQGVFSGRMVYFWKRHAGLEVLFTGSSHVWSGIDPRKITGLQALNMGYPANGWLGQESWVGGYALNHCPRLKVVVMEAFPGWLRHPGGDFTWEQQMSRTKGVRYDMSHGFWKQGLPYRFEDLAAAAPNNTDFNLDSTGYVFHASGSWGGPAYVPGESEWGLDSPEYLANMERIEKFAKLLADRKIHLVLVNYPVSPAFKGFEYYGRHGPRTDVAVSILKRFADMERISPYVHFYDAHRFGDHDYGDAEAADEDHLSSAGAAKLTARLDSLIHTLVP